MWTKVTKHYKEPVNGKFHNVTASVLKELRSNNESDLESKLDTELEVAASTMEQSHQTN